MSCIVLLAGQLKSQNPCLVPFYTFVDNDLDEIFFQQFGCVDTPMLSDDIYWGKITQVYDHYVTVDIGGNAPAILKKKDVKALTQGKFLGVQVLRPEKFDKGAYKNLKGAKVSANLSLAGRFWGIDFQTAKSETSKASQSAQIAPQFLKIFEENKVDPGVVFMRSNLKNLSPHELESFLPEIHKDLNWLIKTYQEIVNTPDKIKVGKVYSASSPLQKYLRDLPAHTNLKIIVGDTNLYHFMVAWLKNFRPDLCARLVFQDEKNNNWCALAGKDFACEQDLIDVLQAQIIELPLGQIVIEKTNVATTIDINCQHADVMAVNRNAISQIAKQIRWRGISGAVLIDFVKADGMPENLWRVERNELENMLKKSLVLKQSKTRVAHVKWSPLGWCELFLRPRN